MVRPIIVCSIVALLLAACGGAPEAEPTEAPPPTPTIVPTLAPVGFPSNPLQLLIVPAVAEMAETAEADLEAILLQSTNVSIDVVMVEQPAEIVAAICESFGLEEGMAAGWVDGMTYASIFEQRCGTGAVQYVRDEATREIGVLLTNANFEGSSSDILAQRSICRLSFNDYYSWVALSLFFYAEGLDPATIQTIDFDNTDEMLEAIDKGECASGMVAQSVWEAWDAENSNRLDENATTVEMPIGILVLPFAAPESARLAITGGLSDFDEATVIDAISGAPDVEQTEVQGTEETTVEPTELFRDIDAVFVAFFGAGTFAPVDANEFDEWFDFLESIGLFDETLGE